MKNQYITSLVIMTALTAGAQNLSKEIVVDKEIILEQRDVTPLSVQPRLVVDPLSPVALPWSRTAVESTPTVEIATLPPAAWRLAIEESPWRGYARGGYFPALQADLSAGYRVISRKTMRMDVWGQYKALNYKNNLSPVDSRLVNNDFTLGVNYRWVPVDNAALSLAVDYLGSSYTMPRYYLSAASGVESHDFRQTVSDFSARVGWEQSVGRVDYGARVGLGHFEFGHGAFYGAENRMGRYKAMNQTTLSASAWVGGKLADAFSARFGLDYDGIYNPGGYMNIDGGGVRMPSMNYGVLTLSPSVASRYHNFRIKLGLNAYVRTGEVSKFKIYPDARIDWVPSQQFSVFAAVGGGRVDLNSFSSLYSRTRYINPSMSLAPATEKLALDAGITIGPFQGFSIEATASSANWSGVVMPLAGSLMEIGLMEQAHLKSLCGGATLRYQYADKVKAMVRYQMASHGRDNGCFYWLDRAGGVFDSRIDVKPIKSLTVSTGYGMRVGRHTFTSDGDRVSLSPARDLYIGAEYRLTDRLSIEANAHNLTASRWQETWGVRNPGMTGFVGATYLF